MGRATELSLVLALGGVLPSVASASNAAVARTPPIYVRAACIVEVDRTVDPTFHLDFGIPFEDVELTDDEPPGSRRFQFFAVCEDEHTSLQTLPNWISMAEAEDALQRELIDALPEAAEVLPSHPKWSSCAFEMNPVESRIPISCDATEPGLDFDTSALPVGNYVVRGYTFEPDLNLWSGRRGVVQVRDGGEPLPAVGLSSPVLGDRIVRAEQGFSIQGCTAGPEGVEVVLQWAALTQLGRGDDEAVWQTFATLDAGDGAFDVLFEPPEAAVNQAVLIRGVADPTGPRRWVDHAEGSLIVFPGDGESDPVAGEPVEWCKFYDEPLDPSTSTGDLTGSSSSGGGAADEDGSGGCACRSEPVSRPTGWLVLLGLGVVFVGRKRH